MAVQKKVPDAIMTTAEAAAELGISQHGVAAAIRRGLLPATAMSTKFYVVKRKDVIKYKHTHSERQGWDKRRAQYGESGCKMRKADHAKAQ